MFPLFTSKFSAKLKQTENFGFCPNKLNNHPNDLVFQDYHMHVKYNLEKPWGNQNPKKFRPNGEIHHKPENFLIK